jgi:rare lipoprotein A
MMKTAKLAFLNFAFLAAATIASAAHVPQNTSHHHAPKVVVASFYSNYYNGHKTANGERFSNNALTAASCELPLGSRVKVTNLENHRSVVVRVNDRGPYVAGRGIDLSRRAAARLGFVREGTAKVRIDQIS